jgi:Ca2+-binding RTX toxin-like protein
VKARSPKKTYSGRMVVLATLVMATVLVLSAPMADARKKHHHVVQCPTGGSSLSCVGTAGNDHLIGRAGTRDLIFGKEGNDVYEGNGGLGDELIDVSTTSSDTYVSKGPDLGTTFVEDCGGSSDTVDLSSTSFRLLDNATISRQDNFTNTCNGTNVDDLILSGPEGYLEIVDQYGTGKVEKIKFANGALTF